jgi:hypothetical protein
MRFALGRMGGVGNGKAHEAQCPASTIQGKRQRRPVHTSKPSKQSKQSKQSKAKQSKAKQSKATQRNTYTRFPRLPERRINKRLAVGEAALEAAQALAHLVVNLPHLMMIGGYTIVVVTLVGWCELSCVNQFM